MHENKATTESREPKDLNSFSTNESDQLNNSGHEVCEYMGATHSSQHTAPDAEHSSTCCCPTHEMWELPTPLIVANRSQQVDEVYGSYPLVLKTSILCLRRCRLDVGVEVEGSFRNRKVRTRIGIVFPFVVIACFVSDISPIRSTTRTETPSSACTRSTDEFCTNGFSSSSWPETIFWRRRAAAAAARGAGGGGGLREERERRYLGIQLAVGPQPLWLRDHNSGPAQRIMVKRLATSPHDPLGITDSSYKNQLVVVSVQYGPLNPYIPIRSTTIGKSRVAIDPISKWLPFVDRSPGHYLSARSEHHNVPYQ
ncbi:hypothetical protein F511_28462 [Dorcoceras hygrometricum]|uniref:Uncharacterized protein n=1 Tax=Dorcoceras hygrometricum TaxID=472368 RepID=A0A2Z7C6Q9_9LAMI|nr:hypothetical protein F511_28462 [Dorcoceras hygrometricum]